MRFAEYVSLDCANTNTIVYRTTYKYPSNLQDDHISRIIPFERYNIGNLIPYSNVRPLFDRFDALCDARVILERKFFQHSIAHSVGSIDRQNDTIGLSIHSSLLSLHHPSGQEMTCETRLQYLLQRTT